MKIRMLCVACFLATAMTGCGEVNDGPGGGFVGDGGSGGSMNNACPQEAKGVAANHIIVKLSWPDTLGLAAGEGEMHVWTRADLTFDGDAVSGEVRPCGSVIPALTKSDIAGGGMVQTQIPDEVWEAGTMPVFQVTGSIDGTSISMEPVASTVGLTMADPLNDPWPAKGAQVEAVDHDGDGKPGILAIPRTDAPFEAPPLDLMGALDPMGARADELYLVTRTVIELSGTRDSCSSAKGTAKVSNVDSHVVGCHIKDGGDCTADQAAFVDDNQPKFTIESATYEMVEVPEDATCADVRAALPM